MVQHPEVLKRAQAEVDVVVGSNQWPVYEDRESLPYCDAIFSETLRWGVPARFTLPHRLMEDDIYDDMIIPKGSLLLRYVDSTRSRSLVISVRFSGMRSSILTHTPSTPIDICIRL
ncbi:cytochrome P450 [Paxillus ammoniavirescens]|nr:cytochrome P450 [Paxillus ammoniavirescens]